MRAQTAYEDAMRAKAVIKEEKDKAQYQKRLDQTYVKLETASKALETVSKYLVELKALRLVLGDE